MKEGVPVSSGGIQTKYFTEISSATIRAELSTLEDMGYLTQPHTSAGRTPTALAYKFYVEHFMPKKSLRKQDMAVIDASLSAKFTEVEEVVRAAARVISDVTNYTSVIVLSNINKVVIKEIKLLGLDENTALLVIITDSGIIRDKLITVGNTDDAFLREAAGLINKIFAGKTVGDIKKNVNVAVAQELQAFRELLDSVLEILITLSDDREEDVIFEGESKLLEYPETNLESAKKFLSVIDDRASLARLMAEEGDIEFSVKIGKDETGGMDRCAIVTAKYMIGGKEIGHAGVIGPERMNYSKVISVLSYVGETIDTILKPDRIAPAKKKKDD